MIIHLFIVTEETIVDDLLSILSPGPKQYMCCPKFPGGLAFPLSYRPTLPLFLSGSVQLFDSGVGVLSYKSVLGPPSSVENVLWKYFKKKV